MLNTYQKPNIVLTLQNQMSKRDQAVKIHRQFAHAPAEKLIKLIRSAGKPWNEDKELEKELHQVQKSCSTCQVYAKAAARPVVGLPNANEFLETVAMDLKFYDSKALLHLIDHATRLSTCVRIPSKKPEHIVKAIFSNWISVYGTTEKFLTDNGGEFVNEEFTEMCESLNIKIKRTGTEAPWSNGLVERHNLIISEMLVKVLEDTKCNFVIALAWCVNAKKSLQNCHGFSPYQLAIGTNPRLPSAIQDKLPALTAQYPTTEILRQNLDALHTAREAFVQCERSEKLRRALSKNTRAYSDMPFLNGDVVYYKRKDNARWRGPATILGKDGQQVLLKHGGYYIRVHPCRIQPCRQKQETTPQRTEGNANHQQKGKPNELPMSESENESEGENNQPTPPTPPETSMIDPNSRQRPYPIEPTGQLNLQQRANTKSTEESTIHRTNATDSSAKPSNDDYGPKDNIKKNDRIRFQTKGEENWMTGTVHSRAGKATGKHKNCWNIKCSDGTMRPIDLKTDVHQWIPISSETSDTEICPSQKFITGLETEIDAAKQRELESWKSREVYQEVKDNGQECLTVRWVITPKVINGKPSLKARLCAKGYQELKDFRTDSPTCAKESIRLALSIAATMKWNLESIDIKAAFLQGSKIDRTIFIKPPTEAKTSKLWELQKCVYGFADAPRQFYLRLREELRILV